MSTVKALIFIIRAFIETFLFLTGKIEAHKYHESMEQMKELITKATTGELPQRTQAGGDIEDQFNRNTKP